MYCSLFTALIAVGAFIKIPIPVVPFTLQTFAVFCALGFLGWGCGGLAVAAYILLGAFGLPVFSGFVGGVGHLFGPTGGYIWGFLFSAALYGLVKKLLGKARFSDFFAMLTGLVGCYAFGTVWFVQVYSGDGDLNYLSALSICVLPFIIPDLVKIFIACRLVKRIKPHIYK